MSLISDTVEPLIEFLLGTATTYNRQNAIAFARQYWNRPCPDDCIALDRSRKDAAHPRIDFFTHVAGCSAAARFKLVPNTFDGLASAGRPYTEALFIGDEVVRAPLAEGAPPTVLSMHYLGDCTHFMSHILKAGGIVLPDANHPPIYGYTGPDNVIGYLTVKTHLATVIGDKNGYEYAPNGQLQPEAWRDDLIKTMVEQHQFGPGDLVAFYGSDGKPFHLALYPGENHTPFIAKNPIICHTYSRADVPDAVLERVDTAMWSVDAVAGNRIKFIRMN